MLYSHDSAPPTFSPVSPPPSSPAPAPPRAAASGDSDDWHPIEAETPVFAPPLRGPQGRPEGAAGPRLDNRGASVPGDPSGKGKKAKKTREKAQTRAEQYAHFADLAAARPLFRSVGAKTVSFCGLRTHTGAARLERGGERAAVVGVSRCSSPWLCPACGPKIAAARAHDLAPQFKALTDSGWSVWLVTLTLRHERGEKLSDLFDVLAKGWNRFRSGRGFQDLRDEAGGFEYVRGYDLTIGGNGWHPHLHLVVALGPAAGDGADLAPKVLDRWRDCLVNLKRQALKRALDIQPARSPAAAAAYAMTLAGVSKSTDRDAPSLSEAERKKAARVGFSQVAEATAAAAKRGRAGGGETAADLRERAVKGDKRAYALFAEYAAATKGRRAVVVSQGLRLKEETAAAEESEVIAPEVVAVLRDKGLRALDRHLPAVLAAAAESVAEGRRLLAERLGPAGEGALWSLPPAPDDTPPDPRATPEALREFRASVKADRDAMRARKNARKKARKAGHAGAPPLWARLAETEALHAAKPADPVAWHPLE